MNDPKYTDPSGLVSRLALDAAVPLYGRLQVPPRDGNFYMQTFLKEAIEYSDFVRSPILWNKVVAYANSTLSDSDRIVWIDWIFNAFTGTHPPDVDLSGWLMALDYYRLPHADWQSTEMSSEEISLVMQFIKRYFEELDEPAFMEAIEEARSLPLTSWDKRMHQSYDFVYFDRSSGADPFLELKFVNQGEALRRTLREYDFNSVPDFPHHSFKSAAQSLLKRRNVWMPEGRQLSALVEVK